MPKNNKIPLSIGRPYTDETITLGNCVIREIKERGIVRKSVLGRLFGKTASGMENVFIYITDVEPHIAETDDGKLIWVK